MSRIEDIEMGLHASYENGRAVGKSDVDSLVSRVIDDAYAHTENQLFSQVDGYDYEIERETGNDSWYIMVRPIDEGYLYDGWWKNSENESIEAAVVEAIKGAGILSD